MLQRQRQHLTTLGYIHAINLLVCMQDSHRLIVCSLFLNVFRSIFMFLAAGLGIAVVVCIVQTLMILHTPPQPQGSALLLATELAKSFISRRSSAGGLEPGQQVEPREVSRHTDACLTVSDPKP